MNTLLGCSHLTHRNEVYLIEVHCNGIGTCTSMSTPILTLATGIMTAAAVADPRLPSPPHPPRSSYSKETGLHIHSCHPA